MSVNLTLSEIRLRLQSDGADSDAFLNALEADPRAGARKLAQTARRRRRARKAEQSRMERMFQFERKLRSRGDRLIAGVDEVGRGPLAGPVTAAAVILPESVDLPLLNDSKALTPEQRQDLSARIRESAVAWALGEASPHEIDTLNILHASLLAMRRALAALSPQPQRVLVDGKWPCRSGIPELALVKGDARSASIAAASILAKVSRDALMAELDRRHPGYDLGRNKGYPSPGHLEALDRLGPSPIHRMSFQAVARSAGGGAPDASQLDLLEADGPMAAVYRTGQDGEAAAARYLEQAGYTILERRHRSAAGEIDLIAANLQAVCFIEVKTSANGSGPAVPQSRVDAQKQRRITEAAALYLETHPLRDDHASEAGGRRTVRFDVITVDLTNRPPVLHHLVDAFRPATELLDK